MKLQERLDDMIITQVKESICNIGLSIFNDKTSQYVRWELDIHMQDESYDNVCDQIRNELW